MTSSTDSPLSSTTRAHLAANVRRLRKSKDLTQEKLSELAEFHPTYISILERKKANISLDGLERIARVLGVTTIELLQAPPEE